MQEDEKIRGRGAQLHTNNKYQQYHYVTEHIEGLDEPLIDGSRETKIYTENPKKIVTHVESPDVYGMYSINPYQGCEHGCIYCYARPTHEYWGYNAGLDFERNIIVKHNAPDLLRSFFDKKSWKPSVINVSGNTDCYQPIERKLKITRQLLEVFLEYKNPVGMITKNSLILRDLDILKQLAELNLVHVMVSITSLDESLRRLMEPRTASSLNRLKVLEVLSKNNISCGVMTAPIIPGLNSSEVPEILKAAANHGARNAEYTIVRLNGPNEAIFHDWIHKHFPNKANKVWNLIKECHGGKVSDSRYRLRMRGEGATADSIAQLFNLAVRKHFKGPKATAMDCSIFERPSKYGQIKLL